MLKYTPLLLCMNSLYLRMTPNTVYDIFIVFCIVIIQYILHILYIYMFMTYSTSQCNFGKLGSMEYVCVCAHAYVCMYVCTYM